MKYTVDSSGIVTVERERPPEADGTVMSGAEKDESIMRTEEDKSTLFSGC